MISFVYRVQAGADGKQYLVCSAVKARAPPPSCEDGCPSEDGFVCPSPTAEFCECDEAKGYVSITVEDGKPTCEKTPAPATSSPWYNQWYVIALIVVVAVLVVAGGLGTFAGVYWTLRQHRKHESAWAIDPDEIIKMDEVT